MKTWAAQSDQNDTNPPKYRRMEIFFTKLSFNEEVLNNMTQLSLTEVLNDESLPVHNLASQQTCSSN